ncbi:MAG: VacJ family lipoprotein [Nitrospiraceae bacterium]|nr:MAG: VacJ family lipoprotein [Nitrospiraceae bacterium]
MMISVSLFLLPFSAGAEEVQTEKTVSGDIPENVLENNSGDEEYFGEDLYLEDDIDFKDLEAYESIPDPLEPLNRIFYTFNDTFYFILFKPVARGYNAVVHKEIRKSVKNAFDNAAMPVRFVNSVIQGKVKSAGVELVRFLVNSTLGLAGLFDVSEKELSLQTDEADLGQTLGIYGLGNGFYIIWPFLGPSSLRDTIGLVGDGFLYPINYIPDREVVFGLTACEYLNENSLRIGQYEDLKSGAIDPYSALKEAYHQKRRDMIEK